MRKFSFGLAVAALWLAGESRAGFVFQTPSGISPGQSFNVVIVDSVGGTAESLNISDYNSAVSSAASGISYPDGSIGSWSIIGATRASNAATALFTSSLPVYDLQGNLLAPTGITYQRGLSPVYDQNGADDYDAFYVWTGLFPLGATFFEDALGYTSYATDLGVPGFVNYGEGLDSGLASAGFSDEEPYYGFSTFNASPAATVPAPSSITLAVVGLVVSAASHVSRRRRHTASRSTDCPPTRLWSGKEIRKRFFGVF